MLIQVQQEDFDVQALYQALLVKNTTGAVAMFVGLVRQFTDGNFTDDSFIDDNVADCTFELEHYPGMTEHNLQQIVDEANGRWPLLDVVVVHRVGKLSLNEQIVFVGVSASHRAEAFSACDYIMDYLKSRAAFWKKETTANQSQWVSAKETDELSLARWHTSNECS